MTEELLKLLEDEKLGFVQKLRYATRCELDIWEARKDPPNLSGEEFKRLMNHIPAATMPKWAPRESISGPHGKTGDDHVFSFRFTVMFIGVRTTYYVKGYFFDKGKTRGVSLQSFRRERARVTRLR